MKKRTIPGKLTTALLLAAAVSLLGACHSAEDNAIAWSDIASVRGEGVANHAVTLEIGQAVRLTAEPADRGLDWATDNAQVATVSAGGVVTAVGLGRAVVTVYPKEYDGIANGNYVVVTVVDRSIGFVDDRIDQEEAE